MTTTEKRLTEQLERSLIRATAGEAIAKTGANATLLLPHVERELTVREGNVVGKNGESVDEVLNRLKTDPQLAAGFAPRREYRTKADFKTDAEKVAFAGKHGWDAYHNLPAK